jgi:hypothetical protein
VLVSGYLYARDGTSRTIARLLSDNPSFIGTLRVQRGRHRCLGDQPDCILTVRRNGGSPGSGLPCNMRPSMGQLRTGRDYVLMPGTLEFHPGETSKTVAVTIVEDPLPERKELCR